MSSLMDQSGDSTKESFDSLVEQPQAQTAQPPQQQSGSFSISTPSTVALEGPIDRSQVDATEADLRGTVAGNRRRAGKTLLQNEALLAGDQNRAQADQQAYQKQADALLQPLNTEHSRLTNQYQELVAAREDHRARMETAIQDMDQMSKKIAAEQPHDIYAEQGLGTKIATMALTGIGAAVQSLYHDKSNPIVDQIDAIVKRDLTMQRLRMDKNKDDYANKNLLLNQMSNHFDHIETAQNAAYITMMDGLKSRMEIAGRMLKTPEMQMDVDQRAAMIDMKLADARQQFQADVGGQEVRMKQSILETEKHLAEVQEKRGAVNTQMRNAAANASRKDASMTIPGVEFKNGFQAGDQSIVNKVGAVNLATQKVYRAMDGMIKELDKAKDVKRLLSSDAYREYKQAESLLIEGARADGFGQTGSRLTDTLKQLEKDSFTPGAIGRLTPEESKKLLLRAQMSIAQTLHDTLRNGHGATGFKNHWLFGTSEGQ